MDYTKLHDQFKHLLTEGQINEAIELIVPVVERPDIHQNSACILINTMVFSALIPEQRLIESMAWLDDSIQGDFGYESWNSVSNLGHVYLLLGKVERAKSLFTTLMESQSGPMDEASEFLKLINSGGASSLKTNQPDPRDNDAYKKLSDYLGESGADQELTDAFSQFRGGTVHGFVQGVLASDGIEQFSPTHDAVALSLWDFLTNTDSGLMPTYAESVEAVTQGSSTKEHGRVIREMAFEGTPGAASTMYTYLRQNHGFAEAWRNVAVARGELVMQPPSSTAETHEIIEAMTDAMDGLQSKVDKADAGKSFIESAGSASLIDALTNWFETEPAQSTEQYYESVGRRILWHYPNGLTLTIGAEINLTIASMNEQLSESSELPEICDSNNWDFLSHANGWMSNQSYDQDTLLEIVQALEDLYGKPTLILPWENRAENTSDEEEEDYVFQDPEDDSYQSYLDVYRLMKLVHSGDINYFSEWELSVVFEDDLMSPFSHFEKYQSFTEELRDSKLAILDLEEHCSACSSGVTERAVEEDPELAGKPLFITWSQNSDGMVRPDGAINIEGHCWNADPETMEKIKALADGLGVPCEIGEGFFHFVSPDWD